YVSYTLSLHDALPIWIANTDSSGSFDRREQSDIGLVLLRRGSQYSQVTRKVFHWMRGHYASQGRLRSHDPDPSSFYCPVQPSVRSEEHTSELQSLRHL